MKNNNNLSDATRSMKRLAFIGTVLAGGAMVMSAATGISDSANYDDLSMAAPIFKVSSPAQQVSGTGTVRYSFKFDIDSGCCMRIKAEMVRKSRLRSLTGASLFGPESVVTSKTFEVSGSLHDGTTLSANLSATEDDADFFIRFNNLDTWNKAKLTVSDLSVSFPTGVLKINTNPNVPLTLQQGQDEDRTFSVPDKQGSLRVDLSWTNAAKVKVQIFKPGAATAIASATSQTGQTTVSIANISVGAGDSGDWRIVYTNLSAQNVVAQSITTTIKMTVVE